MGKFVRAIDKPRGDFAEAALLSLDEKEWLCRDLLDEFAAENLRHESGKHELVHSCILPFGMHAHGDRNPSASLNYEKLTYSCYACGGGGLLWFIASCRGISSEEARIWFGKQTGMGSDEQTLDKLLQMIDAIYSKDTTQARTPIPHLDPRVLDPWLAIHPYMTEIRRISEETLKRFTIGYGKLRVRLGDDIWVDSERIIIPHFWKGELVGWQSRRLFATDGTSRWLSTPDFPKDSTLYNYDPNSRVVVVESPMSVLRHADTTHMEATFGAAVTDVQVRHIAEHPGPVTLWMDNDEAGWSATEKLAESLSPYVPVWVVDSPWAADPADMDTETAAKLIEEAVPYPLWKRPGLLRAWEVAA